jgi:sec-independent protein translocase protein TatA
MTSLPTGLLAFIGNLGMMEWAVILIVALLLFGRRLPEVGRSMGQGIKEFKKGLKDVGDDVQKADDAPARRSLPQDQPTARSADQSVQSAQDRAQTH